MPPQNPHHPLQPKASSSGLDGQSPVSLSYPRAPSPSGYELQDLPPEGSASASRAAFGSPSGRGRQSSSPSPSPDSNAPGPGEPTSPSASDPPLDSGHNTPTMSRTPLLLRSSPAQGTGSYGGLPTMSSSAGNSDADDVQRLDIRSYRSRRKGKKTTRPDDDSGEAESIGLRMTTSRSTLAEDASTQGWPQARRRLSRSAASASEVDTRSDGTRDDLVQLYGPGTEPTANPGSALLPDAQDDDGSQPKETPSDDEDLSADEDELRSKASRDGPADDSPYSVVRASVSPTDDIALSINTPRMWTLSILFAILGSSTNLFFSLRYPSVSITPVIALLLVHPLGLLWDQVFKRQDDPKEVFVSGSLDSRAGETSVSAAPVSRRQRLRLWLAQGRWNAKEHCCVYISSNVSFGFAFATDVIVEQTKFYHQQLGISYQILLTISTQVLGYALAGLTRRYLVRPSGMIWPGTLISTSMFSTLHKEENKPANGWTITRSRFFLYVFFGSVAFYFLPGLLFPALSYFNVITWFAPKNVVVANLFGIASGLGLFPLTFDWSQIAYIGSPLVVPFWAALNILGGLVLVMWILAPLMYYANVMYSSYMPILSSAVFDNTGKPYDVSKILTKDFLFDDEAYRNYSRVFLPITYVLSYALQFAALAALITHTACWHGKDIVRQWKRSLAEIRNKDEADYQPLPTTTSEHAPGRFDSIRSRRSMGDEPNLDNLLTSEDVHNRLMRRYEDVPMTWYLWTGISMAAIGIFVVEYYPIHLPWYGLLLALGICTVLFIPIGIVMAITNQQSSLYLICQLICGVVFPGRPVANMVFVTYGYITSTQGLKFSSDLKLGHYMKIPPRLLFELQITATLVSSFTQIGVLNWMLSNIPGICTAEAINGFTCPLARVHFNGSILWGVVGPTRFFGPGALYRPLVWAFLVGAVAPIFVWLAGRRSKHSFWRKVNLPVLFGSLSWIPPATGLNFSVWAVVCYLFNYVIKRRRTEWWKKYNMTLSAALDSGLAFGVVVIFFGIVYPGWMKNFSWWGTEVYKQGCDWQACSYKEVPEGGHFGPATW